MFTFRVTLACTHCSHLWHREIRHDDWRLETAEIQSECPNCGSAGEAQVFEAVPGPPLALEVSPKK
jgi:hypothetical protein